MFTLRIEGPDGVRELPLEEQTVELGRDARCGVVLAGPGVSQRHLALERHAGHVFFRDLGSTLGVVLVREGEARRVALGRLEPRDALRVGGFTLSVSGRGAGEPLDDDARERLEALKTGDEARQVHADWLESVGRPQEAAWVRAELALRRCDPASADFAARRDALRELTRQVSVSFRAGVSRPIVERCDEGARCPGRWDALELTGDACVRRCPACRRDVFFCDTVHEARQLGVHGERVVIDVSRPRRQGDLGGPHPPR